MVGQVTIHPIHYKNDKNNMRRRPNLEGLIFAFEKTAKLLCFAG